MNNVNITKMLFSSIVALVATQFVVTHVNATPLSIWDSTWTQFAADDGVAAGGYVDPGWGGQAFDAEYLYYKVEGNFLYLGLQTGFDLIDGVQTFSSKQYWAGDLALSFDGNAITGPANPTTMANSYEFGIDFGLKTADYNSLNVDAVKNSVDGQGVGKDMAGIYRVNDGQWNTNMVNSFENDSSPFAMDQRWDGTGANPFLAELLLNEAGTDGTSFYRYVAFDLTTLGLASLDNIAMDAHWTMSCGNDNINGQASFSAPEPSGLILVAMGLIGMAGGQKIRRKS